MTALGRVPLVDPITLKLPLDVLPAAYDPDAALAALLADTNSATYAAVSALIQTIITNTVLQYSSTDNTVAFTQT